ncbi:unnamed protein product [Prunus brigantina]
MAKIDDSTNGGDDKGNPSAEVTKTSIQSARQERYNFEALMVRGRSKDRKNSNRKSSISRTRIALSNRQAMNGTMYMENDNPCSTQAVGIIRIRHHDVMIRELHGVRWKMVKNKTDKKIKVLRSDNGGEYTSDPFFKLCNKEGITHHFSVKGIP